MGNKKTAPPQMEYRDLGLIRYSEAWNLQTELHEQLKAHKKLHPDGEGQRHYLLFCEHPHVYTLGKSGSLDNLLLSEAQLREEGIDYFPINRGGDITYHGPGQLVGYPILDMEHFFTDIHRYVRDIEEAIIRTCADYGLKAGRIEGLSGVWMGLDDERPKRKICAIGIHLSRWVTMHGFAFNVNTDLSLFQHIVPCGIVDKDKTVTSLAKELGWARVDMDEVKDRVKSHLSSILGFISKDG